MEFQKGQNLSPFLSKYRFYTLNTTRTPTLTIIVGLVSVHMDWDEKMCLLTLESTFSDIY